MYASVLLALAATSAFAAPVASPPKGWAHGYLEDYDVYHTRYLALDCYTQHNTTFFSECCRPLLATETLADRPEYCTPNATQNATASAYEASASTATVTATADIAAESDYAAEASSSTAALTTQAAAAAPTSEWVAPTTTSTSEAPAQTSEAPANNGGLSGDVQTGGDATFFYQNGNPGACGNYNSDSTPLVAIDQAWWPNFGQQSDLCGKWVTIKNTNNGKTVSAVIADVCPTCNNANSLDLSVGAFTAIASESDGMVPIEWSFN